MTQKCSEEVDKFNNLFVNAMNAVFRPFMHMESTFFFQYSSNENSKYSCIETVVNSFVRKSFALFIEPNQIKKILKEQPK